MTRDINQWPYQGDDGMEQNYRKGIKAWTETTETAYDDQLGCLPPIRWKSRAFMVGECFTHRESDGASMYAAFMEVDGRFFGRIVALKEFDPAAFLSEIKSQFGI
jgi:hypothetical protein